MRRRSSVVQPCPPAGTYWRSSSQITHSGGGVVLSGYCVPHAVQMNIGITRSFQSCSRRVRDLENVDQLAVAPLCDVADAAPRRFLGNAVDDELLYLGGQPWLAAIVDPGLSRRRDVVHEVGHAALTAGE